MDTDKYHEHLLGILEDAVEALQARAEAKPPRVRVDVAPPGAPVVNVEVKAAEIPRAAPPVVNVAPAVARPCAYTVAVTERDSQNFIRELRITPSK